MEVTTQPATLLLTGGNKPLSGALEFRGELHGMGSHPGVAGDISQQPLVGRCQALPRATRCHQQLAHRFSLVVER
jgi:hypothetical protein